jgi:hypothetical protein
VKYLKYTVYFSFVPFYFILHFLIEKREIPLHAMEAHEVRGGVAPTHS